MAKKLSYKEEDEDNIVIANMNVEGMPWYQKEEPEIPEADNFEAPGAKQTFQIIMGALKAGLLVVLVFAVGLVLFTLFCTLVWFR